MEEEVVMPGAAMYSGPNRASTACPLVLVLFTNRDGESPPADEPAATAVLARGGLFLQW